MRIIMNQYERENVEQIKSEIRAYEEKNGKMPKEKIAYYIYRRMGQSYLYKEAYELIRNIKGKKEYEEVVAIFQEGTNENGEALCTDMNKACVEFMKEMGITAKYLAVEAKEKELYHADGCFEVNGVYYLFNLVPDLMRIQTGMRTRNFGISQQKLATRYKNAKSEQILKRMNEEIKGNNFTEIPSETIQEWDNEFGFTYKGLYTNDVLKMLRTECFDKEFMEDFFGTKKPDELVQRKFEFVMKYIGIIKANQNRKLGNVEATRYYLKLSESILSKQEMNHYIELCIGFIEERKRRKAKNIAIIKKEKENVYYLYNSDKQIYEKIEKEELIKQGIQYYSFKRDKDVPIETFIKEKEQELIERMKKHSEDIEL